MVRDCDQAELNNHQPTKSAAWRREMMTDIKKRHLKQQIRAWKDFAHEVGVSASALSRAMSGGAGLKRETAARAAALANKLTDLNCYEAADFNNALSPNLLEISPDIWVEIADVKIWQRERMTARRFSSLYADELDMLSALHNLVWDGEPQLVGNKVVSLYDSEDYTDV